jgi:GntR family transcriptional regulator/MocR family aminotransferase
MSRVFDESGAWALHRQPGETLRGCLERTLREAIREGALRAGVELPASRQLAAQLGVSRGVTTDAYAELEAQGYLQVFPRRPPIVVQVPAAAPRPIAPAPVRRPPLRFDMTPTTPDVTLFPRKQWAAALAATIHQGDPSVLGYGDPQGTRVLRQRLADELGRTRGVICQPENIIIVQGSAQGLDLTMRVLRQSGAARIAVEDPSLGRQHQQITAQGHQLLGQPVDGNGIVVGGLRADAVIVSPAHQFPTGAVLSGTRRRELLAWSRDTGGLIIEDDYDAEFRYDREPIRALQGLHPDRVLYLGSTSKTLAPALRLGWLVAPDRWVEQLANGKSLLDDFSPTLGQLAFARLLERGDYQRHIRKTRAVYRDRRDRLIAALAAHRPDLRISGIAAGLSVLLNLAPDTDDRDIERTAQAAGIRVEALSRYALRDRGDRGLVVGYGRLRGAAIPAAVAALTRLLPAPAVGPPRRRPQDVATDA